MNKVKKNYLHSSESDTEIDFNEELIQMNNWLVREPYLPKNIGEVKVTREDQR